MYDILIFVYENFFSSGIYPNNSVLQNRLFAAGFEPDEVEHALAWLEVVDQLPISTFETSSCGSLRCLSDAEFDKLGQEGWGFLSFLEGSGILGAEQREWIISGAVAIEGGPISLDQLKLITLTVFWRHGHPMDIMLMEELIGDTEPLIH